MSTAVYTLPAPPIDRREVLRYARGREGDAATEALLNEVIAEAAPLYTYTATTRILPLTVGEDTVTLDGLTLSSRALAAALCGAGRALLLAVTVGPRADRLLSRYARLSPARALLLDALGSERAEALCEATVAHVTAEGYRLTRRFSPGYGDLPLAAQRVLFSLLDCERTLGLTLNESLLMSPAKSVTAIAGILD